MGLTPRRLDELPALAPQTIALLRDSHRLLLPRREALTREFYRSLFAMAPATRGMFPPDITPDRDRLVRAVLDTVDSLDDPASLEPRLRAWGAWHRTSLGVTDELYVYVGHALLRALRQVLDHPETSVGSAWVAYYEWVTAMMIDGADEPEPDPPPVGVIPGPRRSTQS